MRGTIAQYIRNCDTCSRIKPARHAPYRLLKPLEIPIQRWTSVSLDLISGFPPLNGYDALLVVVDRPCKMAPYIANTTDVSSKGTAKLYLYNIFRFHGLPDSVVSDWGTQFSCDFTQALCNLPGIQQKMSISFHPKTDAQTERVNAIVEQYLRGY